jgi:hypothetical protein
MKYKWIKQMKEILVQSSSWVDTTSLSSSINNNHWLDKNTDDGTPLFLWLTEVGWERRQLLNVGRLDLEKVPKDFWIFQYFLDWKKSPLKISGVRNLIIAAIKHTQQ